MKTATKSTESTAQDKYRKKACRYCGERLTEPFLDLGVMALANSFVPKEKLGTPEFRCPLRVVWCQRCHLVQLADVVPPDLMFSKYLYVSSTTKTLRDHFAEYARTARTRLGETKASPLAVDIGSNDGLLLSCYQKEGFRAVGVEPARNLSEEANRKGLSTVNEYFCEYAVDEILRQHGAAEVISANNVFAHIDNIHEVCRNVAKLLSLKGIFIIEFPYLVTMVEEMLFDMIYHEHLSYIRVAPLDFLLRQFDLEIFGIEKVASHGGSLRVFIQKKGGGRSQGKEVKLLLREEEDKGYSTFPLYQDFAQRVHRVKEKLLGFVRDVQSKGGRIAGYGAPAKGNTLINFCGLTPREISYLVDENPLKQGLLSPGAHIPAVSGSRLFAEPPSVVILFAWNFAAEILKKLEPLRKKGVRFIVPLPEPRWV